MALCKDAFVDYPESIVGQAGGSTCEAEVTWPGALCQVHLSAFYEAISTPLVDVEDDYKKKAAPQSKGERDPREYEAIKFIKEYTGNFDFILDLRARREWGTKYYRLTPRQTDAVLRVKAREATRNQERKAKETGRDLLVLPVGRTHAAVDNESGGVTFLIFERPPDNNAKWGGWVFVKQQQGPTMVKIGSQRPGESYVGQWPSLIDKVLDDPMAAVVRYGLELGVCGVCGLPLTNDESRAKGIGPICEGKLAR